MKLLFILAITFSLSSCQEQTQSESDSQAPDDIAQNKSIDTDGEQLDQGTEVSGALVFIPTQFDIIAGIVGDKLLSFHPEFKTVIQSKEFRLFYIHLFPNDQYSTKISEINFVFSKTVSSNISHYELSDGDLNTFINIPEGKLNKNATVVKLDLGINDKAILKEITLKLKDQIRIFKMLIYANNNEGDALELIYSAISLADNRADIIFKDSILKLKIKFNECNRAHMYNNNLAECAAKKVYCSDIDLFQFF